MSDKKLILVYEKEFNFNSNQHKNCKNQEIIRSRKYFVQKYDLKDVKGTFAHDFAFRVVLDKSADDDMKNPRYKSVVYGDRGGECDSAQTDENFERCGFSTRLMTLCFQDPDITKNGGVDSELEEQFKNNPEQQKVAAARCQTLVTLNQSANPPAAGVAYTKAAIAANFKTVFTVTPGGNNMMFWTVVDAEKE